MKPRLNPSQSERSLQSILLTHLCFSSLLCRLFLRRDELDNPHKPKTWKVYKDNFAIDLTFKRP